MTRSTKIFKYVGKRLLQGIPIILAIVVINFFLLNLAEGDAVDAVSYTHLTLPTTPYV